MHIQSVKARFMGSYILLLILFVVQIPVVYVLVGGMSEKYGQVERAGSLRKRAIELAEVLNRRIATGNESLEAQFQAKKVEFGRVLGELRAGTRELPAVTGPDLIARLDEVDRNWGAMRAALDKAMESGGAFRKSKAEVESSTLPMVEMLNDMISSIERLRDPAYVKYINVSGLQRMRTAKLSYLFERYFISYDDKDEVSKEINHTIADFDGTLKELKTVSASVAGRGASGARVAEAVKKADDAWQSRKESILSGMRSIESYSAQLNALVDTHTPGLVAAADGLTRLITDRARAGALRGVLIMAVSALMSAVIAALFMWSTKSQVLEPITRVKETVEAFARGDLTGRAGIKIRFFGREIEDEITSLGQSVDAMTSRMSTVIGRITESSNRLASASEELSTSSTQISDGAGMQSSQTAHAAAAMEVMNAIVVDVARNSHQAAESAEKAQEIAENGGTVVSQAVSAMQEVADSASVTAETIKRLGKSSEEIGAIVSVINDIADQTNLLALNAAIEAARAGDQGRGFAVVADEVRKLAERTTKATKEISGMITSIQNETSRAVTAMDQGAVKVENGVRLAHQAGESLNRIVTSVGSVTDTIGRIAASAEEQSATTDEITHNMDAIAEVAKSNVSAIGEASRATDDLARLAAELKDLVSNFNISQDGPPAAPSVISGGPLLDLMDRGQRPRFKPRLVSGKSV
ncbi:MAG: type IV pili methyl-accepting chemotaxis transducer N-terminal domain-containing protein [Deltaproteobacteria bacterium]|nr:type IV pili methyl-accepting chemotaxis transducer N-terminal domain-containing protein [Deltaproteobacteria bacterium]